MAAARGFQKLWLLFAVVATALVWTWSQVAQQHGPDPKDNVSQDSFSLLRTEPDCNLAEGPCAAYGTDFALVAVVAVDGEGLRWQLKFAGAKRPPVPTFEVSLIAPDRSSTALRAVQVGDQWQAHSQGLAMAGSTLRVRVSGAGQVWVADYPLRASQP